MSKHILPCLVVFLFLFSASGQELAPNPKSAEDSRAQQELNKKADALLSEIVQHSRDLKSKENQIIVKIAVADLLWKDHEANARILYKQAFEMLRPTQDSDDESNPEAVDSEQSLSQLRVRLLESLGRHDPMMARYLLREAQLPLQSDSASPEASPSADDETADTRLELSLATQLVDQDPKEAVRIAKRALDEGYPYELMYLLPKLAEKDPNAAKELAISIIAKLRKEDFATNFEAAILAVYLVSDAISSAQVDKEAEEKAEKRTPLIDPQTAREFIELLTDAALKKQSARSSGNLLMSLRPIIEGIEQFAPAQASLLRQKLLEMEKENGSDADPYARFHQLSETNDTKAMMELAGSAPREARDGLYSQTASVFWKQGDRAKANEIITTKITSAGERSRLLNEFQQQAIAELMEKEEFVQARQLINQMRSSQDRVQQLIELAAAMMEKGDKKVALEILQEAHALVAVKAKKLYELEAQLKIAGAFSELDADRSFAIIDSAIDRINELMTATALIAGFDYGPTMMRDDEFTIDTSSTLRYGFSALSPKSVRTLAQFDFNRTKETLGRFQRPELRLTAYLLMAESILEPEPSPADCTCEERLKKLKSKAASDLPDQAPR